MNEERIPEYRAAQDAAEGVAMAEGLRQVFAEHLTPDEYLAACGPLDEIRERAGSDPRPHARRAQRILNELVASNRLLVKKVARRTLGHRAAIPANLEEAIQEGSMGLVRAIEAFDVSRGKFSTWASFQIRHYVQTCMHKQEDFAKQRSACMPPKVAKAVNKFRLLNGREPKPEEITYKTQAGEEKRVTQGEWDRWADVTYTTSLDAGARNQETGEHETTGDLRSDAIADPKENPETVVGNLHLSEKLATAMSEMSPRNRELTRALFIEGRNYPDVAKQFDLCPQRVHQLKGVLEKRLRAVLAA